VYFLNKVHAGGQLVFDVLEGGGALGSGGKVEAGTEGHQMCVIGGGDDGDGARAAGKGIAQLIAQELQFVSFETMVVIDNVVVGGTAGALDTAMGAEEEVKLAWVADGSVNNGSGGDVPGAITVLRLGHKEAGVVTLLHQDKGDGGGVRGINVTAGLLQSRKLKLQDLGELALGDTVTVEEDAMGQDFAGVTEALKEALGHPAQILNDFLSASLDTDGSSVARHLNVHGSNDGSHGRLVALPNTGMGDVSTKDNGGLVSDEGELAAEG